MPSEFGSLQMRLFWVIFDLSFEFCHSRKGVRFFLSAILILHSLTSINKIVGTVEEEDDALCLSSTTLPPKKNPMKKQT